MFEKFAYELGFPGEEWKKLRNGLCAYLILTFGWMRALDAGVVPLAMLAFCGIIVVATRTFDKKVHQRYVLLSISQFMLPSVLAAALEFFLGFVPAMTILPLSAQLGVLVLLVLQLFERTTGNQEFGRLWRVWARLYPVALLCLMSAYVQMLYKLEALAPKGMWMIGQLVKIVSALP